LDLKNYLANKKVALVGPASSAIGQSYGKLIESYDIVARIKSFDFNEKYNVDLGKRTDVLYTDRVLHKSDNYINLGYKPPGQYYANYDIFEQKNIKHIICNFPKSNWVYLERLKPEFEMLIQRINIPISNTNSNRYNSMLSLLSRPNAGLIAIVDLLGYDISELFIIGLDFFRTGYNESNFNNFLKRDLIKQWHSNSDRGEYHNTDMQYLFFKYNLLKNDNRIKIDKGFSDILDDKSKDCMFELENVSPEDKAKTLDRLKQFMLG